MIDSIRKADTDEMSLGELVELAKGAQNYVNGHQQRLWTEWLEDFYDPAKSALVDLLVQFDVIKDD